MHFRKFAVCLLILILGIGGIIVSGCTKSVSGKVEKPEEVRSAKKSQLKTITVYFATCDDYMVPLTYSFKEPLEDPAKVAIEKLVEGPNSDYLVRTLPKETRLKNCYVSNDIAYVDFTGDFSKFKDYQEATIAVKSLCLTLGSIPGIEHVQILVDGRTVDEIQGVSMGQMLTHSCVNYFGSGNPENKYKVFWADPNAVYMIPITYAAESPEGLPRQALERLLEGPDSDCLYATVWPGTKILGLKIKDGIATVNLSKEAVGYGGGTTAEGLFVKSILLTLGQFSDIRAVQILIEGEKAQLLPEGTQIGIPLQPPAYANYIAEGADLPGI